jgi:hypothetical protein
VEATGLYAAKLRSNFHDAGAQGTIEYPAVPIGRHFTGVAVTQVRRGFSFLARVGTHVLNSALSNRGLDGAVSRFVAPLQKLGEQ